MQTTIALHMRRRDIYDIIEFGSSRSTKMAGLIVLSRRLAPDNKKLLLVSHTGKNNRENGAVDAVSSL